MASLILKSYETILQQMINVVVARTNPGLSDVTDSSVFKHLLSAPSRELDEVYYQMGQFPDLFSIDTASGEDLDRRAAEMQPALLTRNQATKSTGTVTFARSGTVGSVTIPSGTVVKTASGVKFSTIIDGAIANGQTSSGPVSALAQVAGISGNVAITAISAFDSKPTGVETVSNSDTFIGGLDQESDDAFRARLKRFIATLARCTPEALEFIATGATLATGQRIAFAHVVEDSVNRGEVYLYLDDGSGTIEVTSLRTAEVLTQGLGGPYNNGDSAKGGEEFLHANFKPMKVDPFNPGASVTVTSTTINGGPGRGVLAYGVDFLLNDTDSEFKMTPALATGEVITATYTSYGGLIALAQKIIDGDPADRANFPGWRAAGVRVHCLPPQILQQFVAASVLVQEGYVKGTLLGGGVYTAGSVLSQVADAVGAYINGLGISGDVIRSELITRIMEVPGVLNTTVNLPASDVILLDTQLPRVVVSNISLT